MGALADCETVIDSVLGQPVNSMTALAFVVAGMVIIGRGRRTWVGIAVIAAGVGSLLFHGPMPPYSEWLHDTTLAWLLLVVACEGRPWEGPARLPGLALIAALCAIPGVGDPLGAILAVGAIVNVLTTERTKSSVRAVALLVAVAVVGRLGASGGPLCDPDSLWQPHGLWHIGAATALAWWGLSPAQTTS